MRTQPRWDITVRQKATSERQRAGNIFSRLKIFSQQIMQLDATDKICIYEISEKVGHSDRKRL